MQTLLRNFDEIGILHSLVSYQYLPFGPVSLLQLSSLSTIKFEGAEAMYRQWILFLVFILGACAKGSQSGSKDVDSDSNVDAASDRNDQDPAFSEVPPEPASGGILIKAFNHPEYGLVYFETSALAKLADQVASYECQLDSSGWQECHSPFHLPPQATGQSYKFEVRAVLEDGKRSPTVFIDQERVLNFRGFRNRPRDAIVLNNKVISAGGTTAGFFQNPGYIRLDWERKEYLGSAHQSIGVQDEDGGHGHIRGLVLDPSNPNRVYLYGNFDFYGGNPARGLVRIFRTGERDPSFNMGEGFAHGNVTKLVASTEAKIYVKASTNRYNDRPIRRGLVRLNENGSIDESFSVSEDLPCGIVETSDFFVLQNDDILVKLHCEYSFNGSSGFWVRLDSSGNPVRVFDKTEIDEDNFVIVDEARNRVIKVEVGMISTIKLNEDQAAVTFSDTLLNGQTLRDFTLLKNGQILVVGVFNVNGRFNYSKKIKINGEIDDSWSNSDAARSFGALTAFHEEPTSGELVRVYSEAETTQNFYERFSADGEFIERGDLSEFLNINSFASDVGDLQFVEGEAWIPEQSTVEIDESPHLHILDADSFEIKSFKMPNQGGTTWSYALAKDALNHEQFYFGRQESIVRLNEDAEIQQLFDLALSGSHSVRNLLSFDDKILVATDVSGSSQDPASFYLYARNGQRIMSFNSNIDLDGATIHKMKAFDTINGKRILIYASIEGEQRLFCLKLDGKEDLNFQANIGIYDSINSQLDFRALDQNTLILGVPSKDFQARHSLRILKMDWSGNLLELDKISSPDHEFYGFHGFLSDDEYLYSFRGDTDRLRRIRKASISLSDDLSHPILESQLLNGWIDQVLHVNGEYWLHGYEENYGVNKSQYLFPFED